MRRLKLILVFAIVTALALTTAHIILAQQQRGGMQQRQGRQQRQFDPEQMIERRVQNIEQDMQELNISKEETDLLKNEIAKLLRKRMEQSSDMRSAIEELQQAMDAKDEAQIKEKLDKVKSKRKEQKAEAEKMEKDLLEVLPLKVEALLTVQGVVNGDSSGGFGGFGMRFGGARGQGRTQGAEAQRMMQRGPGE